MKRNFTEQELIRREKLAKLRELGIEPYFSKFIPSIGNEILHEKYSDVSKEELNENHTLDYSISGRVMMIRDQGKAKFIVLKSDSGVMQTYIREDELTAKN
jgi:lysyl-tRNA synthetase class 2